MLFKLFGVGVELLIPNFVVCFVLRFNQIHPSKNLANMCVPAHAAICECASGVSPFCQKCEPPLREISHPTHGDTIKRKTRQLKSKNMHLYLLSNRYQTEGEWHSVNTKILRDSKSLVFQNPISASLRKLCCGLHVNTKVPVVNNRACLDSVSFPTSHEASCILLPAPFTQMLNCPRCLICSLLFFADFVSSAQLCHSNYSQFPFSF